MEFFTTAINSLQTLVVALGAGFGVWGVTTCFKTAASVLIVSNTWNIVMGIKEVSELRIQVINYMRTKEVFAEYKRRGYPRAFLEANEADISMQREAKRFFNEHGFKKLPTGAKLKEEVDRLKAEKSAAYEAYRKARDEMRELLVVRENVERILRENAANEKDRENTRTK